MDESWRKSACIGSCDYIIPRRHSTEQLRQHRSSNNNKISMRHLRSCDDTTAINFDHKTTVQEEEEEEEKLDFHDVFGGPPQTLLLQRRRRFSSNDFGSNSITTDHSASSPYRSTAIPTAAAIADNFYDEIFSTIRPSTQAPLLSDHDHHHDRDADQVTNNRRYHSGIRGRSRGSRFGGFGDDHLQQQQQQHDLLSTETTGMRRCTPSTCTERILPSLSISPSNSTSWSSPQRTRARRPISGGVAIAGGGQTTTTSVQTDHEGFYDDIFATVHAAAAAASSSDGGGSSSSCCCTADHHTTNSTSTSTSYYYKSKSIPYKKSVHSARSSAAISSEEDVMIPDILNTKNNITISMKPGHDDDDTHLSSFASKLRPITIPTTRLDSSLPPSPFSQGQGEGDDAYAWEQTSHEALTVNQPLPSVSFLDLIISSPIPLPLPLPLKEGKISTCSNSSSMSSLFQHKLQIPCDDDDHDHDHDHDRSSMHHQLMMVNNRQMMTQYSCHSRSAMMGETTDEEGAAAAAAAVAVDEAIAWAKEKSFWNPSQQLLMEQEEEEEEEVKHHKQEALPPLNSCSQLDATLLPTKFLVSIDGSSRTMRIEDDDVTD